ncbi:MAG: AAA family ATPase [archaeon]|nr:AAA family ATPase [archaeon]
MYRISVYGKGGVGKSTVSSNLSYLLSLDGLKVLHVGCDPKHDSTRYLTRGKAQKTFMDSLFDGKEEGVIEQGSNGVSCVECGGAEPGIGCAGKGMTSMFSFLDKHTPEDTDVRVCDVLGDVVCGGFSVPMRKSHTDGILIVLSEDFMSIYAANNILRGIVNLNGSACIIGLVLNSRSDEGRSRVDAFSEAIGIPIVAVIDRSPVFSKAESAGMTVCEAFPDSKSASELKTVGFAVRSAMDGKVPLYEAHPLSDKAMVQIAEGVPVTDRDPPAVRTKCRFDNYDAERNMKYRGDFVMPACTSHGAVEALLSVKDAAVVLHGASNCAYLMEYAKRRRCLQSAPLRGEVTSCNLYSTCMTPETVFGGDRKAISDAVDRAYNDGFHTVFLVSTCVPETIGTDMGSIAESLCRDGLNVIHVPADERFLGSKFGSFKGGIQALAGLMDWSLEPEKDTVCILAFDPVGMSRKENISALDELFGAFGLKLRLMFTNHCTLKELEGIPRCEYFVRFGKGYLPRHIAEIALQGRRQVINIDTPDGMDGIVEWCEKFREITGRSCGDFVERKNAEYLSRIEPYRKYCEGRRFMFFVRYEMYTDPFYRMITDLGGEVVARAVWKGDIEIGDYRKSEAPVKEIECEFCHLSDLAKELNVDMVIGADPRLGKLDIPWCGFGAPFMGVDHAISWISKLVNSMALKPVQKWKVIGK